MAVRVLITGSREFTDRQTVAAALTDVWRENGKQQLVVVHGSARGADSLAAAVADNQPDHHLIQEAHPADWRPNGVLDRAAGHKRNAEMIATGVDICLAFFKTGAGNRGTTGCVALARKAGIQVREFWQADQ